MRYSLSALAAVAFFGLLSANGCGKSKSTNSSSTESFGRFKLEKIAPRNGVLGQPLPAQTRVNDNNGETLAILTQNSRTVLFLDSERTFQESQSEKTVTTNAWVRILSEPFQSSIPQNWFEAALDANKQGTPDIFALGMQYLQNSPEITDSAGAVIAGDASYGPFSADGLSRVGGSDIMDFIGKKIIGVLSNGRSNPKAENSKSLDCSGYVRMLFGYRSTLSVDGNSIIIPLAKQTPAEENTLPRTAAEIMAGKLGNMIVPDSGTQITEFDDLLPGDLLFFRAEQESERDIDHVAIYLGLDSQNGHRFLSSRKTADGPTMGDLGGASLINGNGIYSRSFHAVKRL